MELETLRLMPDAQGRENELSEQCSAALLSDAIDKLGHILISLKQLHNGNDDTENSGEAHCETTPEIKTTSAIQELEQHVMALPSHKAPQPDEALLRQIIRQRRLRARFFDKRLFHEPAWNMLLDLAAAHAEQIKVSVSSLCQASGVPATSALRWIAMMSELDLVVRIEDPNDRRRTQIQISAKGLDAMRKYFSTAGLDAKLMV